MPGLAFFFLLFVRFFFVFFRRPVDTVDVVEEAAAVLGARAAVVAVAVVGVAVLTAAVVWNRRGQLRAPCPGSPQTQHRRWLLPLLLLLLLVLRRLRLPLSRVLFRWRPPLFCRLLRLPRGLLSVAPAAFHAAFSPPSPKAIFFARIPLLPKACRRWQLSLQMPEVMYL